MKYERLWERLISELDRVGPTTELEPGRIEVKLPQGGGRPRRIEIVMTRNEWDELVTLPFGDFTTAFAHVRDCLRRLEGQHRFLVYQSYDLVPSETPTLAPDAFDMDRNRLLREDPDAFRWLANPPDSDG